MKTNNDNGRIIEIQGSLTCFETGFEKVVLAVIMVCGSIPLWKQVDYTEEGMWYGIVALILMGIALVLPSSSCTYLDPSAKQIVIVKFYGWAQRKKIEHSFEEYARIVIRHICHSGGETEDTYSGSVGLKPIDQGPVLWLKEFPATQEEVPQESLAFARKIHDITGLPITGLIPARI